MQKKRNLSISLGVQRGNLLSDRTSSILDAIKCDHFKEAITDSHLKENGEIKFFVNLLSRPLRCKGKANVA